MAQRGPNQNPCKQYDLQTNFIRNSNPFHVAVEQFLMNLGATKSITTRVLIGIYEFLKKLTEIIRQFIIIRVLLLASGGSLSESEGTAIVIRVINWHQSGAVYNRSVDMDSQALQTPVSVPVCLNRRQELCGTCHYDKAPKWKYI